MTALLQDLRYGLRNLRRSPGFTAVALATLVLGIGATTAIFTVVHAVLLKPLPYEAPHRIVKVWETNPDGDARVVVSPGNYLDWRDRATSFEELGAHSWGFGMALTGDGDPVQARVVRITPAALRILGVPAMHGRTFTADEAEPGGPAVALISHGLWRQRFGGDAGVIGGTMTLDDTEFTVVGVMPPDFDYPDSETQVWYPLRFTAEDRDVRHSHRWNVLGRLGTEAGIERAQADMDALARSIAAEHPQHMAGWGVNVVPLRGDLVGDVRPLLLVLFGVVGVVLLIACANLVNLLLARALNREHEIAIRGALGASRGRLVRQLLTESGVLALIGGGLAVAVVALGLDLLVGLAPPDIPLLDDVRVSGAMLAFAAGITVLVTLLFGLVPALRMPAQGLRSGLASGTLRGGVRHGRLQSALIVGEVALSLVLLVGAGLLARSFMILHAVDYGFEPREVLAVGVDLPHSRYDTHASQVAFYDRLLERVRAVPGVASVGSTSEAPVVGFANSYTFRIDGRPAADPSGYEDDELLHAVTPGYFDALRIPLVRGRVFGEADRADAPPVIAISQSLARKHWPDENPIGERLSFSDDGPWFEIVGVVGDTRHFGLDRESPPALYIPYKQKSWEWLSWQVLMLRAEAGVDPATLTPSVRAAIHELDPALPLDPLLTLEDAYAETTARRGFALTLVGAFAALALLLGSLGLYGILAYGVAQRRREIGVRMALGATEQDVLGRVLRRGLGLALLGVAIGLAGAFATSRLLSSLLYGISPTDPATFVGVSLLLASVALLASWLPARRATRVDPMTALRAE